jgi:hypothetical protein
MTCAISIIFTENCAECLFGHYSDAEKILVDEASCVILAPKITKYQLFETYPCQIVATSPPIIRVSREH